MPLDQVDRPPFWLVNVPRDEWSGDCPEYLLNLSEKDEKHLALPDEDYRWLTWEDVKKNVATDRLDSFFRLPSELRRYRKYCHALERDYGSVMNFMLWERLKWSSLEPHSSTPFGCEDDYKILCNDWPYGIDARIVHIVVWTKTLFDANPDTGQLTTAASQQIDNFVQTTFGRNIARENNPISLRSVQAVEHFHVMLYDPDPEVVRNVTKGDVPMSQTISLSNEDELA